MDALFLKLLNLSMTAGWLILFVVILRLIFRKAPRWVFCLLWGLVALRLICPLSLESKFSLVPDVQPPPGLTAEYRVADALIEIDPVAGETVIEDGPILIPIQGGDKTAEPSQSGGPVIVARSSAGGIIRVAAVAAWVWLAGLILMVGYALVSYLLLRRRVATATLLRENIKQSERVDSPFVLGLFRPTIYLPYSMDEGDMAHVISHERAHIRRGDHWWKPLGFLILAVYWFNPLVWAAYILFCRDMELACDEKVAANMAHEERQAYSTALLHCGVRRRTVAACPLAFGEVGVKSRVKSVMHYKKPAFWVVLVAIVVCIVAAVCFLTVPEKTDDSDQPTTITKPEEEALRQKYPEYFDLNTAKGLEVYVWKTAEDSYHCGVLPGTNRDKMDEEISRLSANGASIEEMKLILSSYDISKENIFIVPYHPSDSRQFQPLGTSDIQDINTSFGYTVTEPEDDTNWALQQSVWQVSADGTLSPQLAAAEMAEKIAANYLALPDRTDWKPEGVRVTNAEVFDHYWGETPQFCFNIGFEIKLTREQRWQTGPWASWGGEDEDGDGWWPFGAEVYVRKNETGDWAYRSWGTGGYSVSLSDGEGLAYLVDCFWLTEGWTHDWILPYTILDMTNEQLADLPALLDQRTEAEAKKFCTHLGGMLREYDYWVQTTESLKPILGRYGVYLDA